MGEELVKKQCKEAPESISYPVWWKPGGGMMYRRDCLSPDHPESSYNYLKRHYPGLNPENYGVDKSVVVRRCPHCGGMLND